MTDREILLSLCASLTLCDHMGDVSEDVDAALELAGIKIGDDNDDDWGTRVARTLHGLGVKTLYGSEVASDD